MRHTKHMLALGMTLMMGLSLVACGSKNNNSQADSNTGVNNAGSADVNGEAASTITVTTINGNQETVEIEIPYNPDRVAVLDMAVLDMMDNWNLGNKVVSTAKSSSIDYLSDYFNNDTITDLGSLKEVDMEALMESEPEVIFISGRLSSQYDALSKIAPVVYLTTDYEAGLLNSIKANATKVASIFGVEDKVTSQFDSFESRVAALKEAASGKTAVVGLVTSSNFNTLGNDGRCSIIGTDIGFENLANDVDSTHGNEASFELLPELNPDYIFVLDRDSAINAEGAKLAQEVMENELVQKTSAYQNGNIVYLTPSVWYLAEGGLTATDVMLKDIETAILK